LRSALQASDQQHAAGIILDLRDNPGGLLNEAIDISSEFVGSGTVLLEEGRNGTKKPDLVKPGGIATTIPLVVLINQGTASAAEITAGAIKDHQRAQLVGETTFGTGTVLNTYSLSDGSEVLLGTEEWLTPNGTLIWHHGITPTQPVALPANVMPLYPDAETNESGAQIAQSPDTQLGQAIKDLAP
jgi:carboxyl-terminal processing protease